MIFGGKKYNGLTMWLAGHSDWQYLKGFWNIWNSNDKTKKMKKL